MEPQTISLQTEIVPIEARQQKEESLAVKVQYESFEIVSADAYAAAGDDLRAIKAKYKEVDTLRKTLTKPLDESKSKIMAFFKVPLDNLKAAEGAVNTAMVGWHSEQERLRKIEEDRIREDQRKEATRLAKLAENAQKRGDVKKMNEFDARSEAVSFSQPTLPTRTAKVEGLAMVKTWKYRITDASKIPREYMKVNDAMLGASARLYKGAISVCSEIVCGSIVILLCVAE